MKEEVGSRHRYCRDLALTSSVYNWRDQYSGKERTPPRDVEGNNPKETPVLWLSVFCGWSFHLQQAGDSGHEVYDGKRLDGRYS
ncbi:hypothetical protein ADUPG1_012873 [Aduncisulcus paluster]|uniref:Uncharacterized protein n=1 Tax=Aduncisulcus paluster TaxID=2918883 RepID=A0ABQ5K0Y8_9EUKA|nr:hypothetical protein ADUPG1_012873 [Aduncisulcus paluster]